MPRFSQRRMRFLGPACALTVALFMGASVQGAGTRGTEGLTQDELWRQGVDLVEQGEFERATQTIGRINAGGQLGERVRTWLEEYQTKQEDRRRLDKEDFEKYVGYAKARIERKEYDRALLWVLNALDCAEDRDALLAHQWVQDLVNTSLETAEALRKEHDWKGAWDYYWKLADIFETDPRYQKLQREILTHLRLDMMFKEDSHWEERLEKVRWEDAKEALEYIGLYYVEPPDFKEITEGALEHLLLLAESKTARERFKGLGDEDERNDFVARVRERLAQVQAAPSLDRRGAVEHLRRVVKKINPQTVDLPRELVVSELMRGALEPLDEFTTIIWPQDARDFERHTRGDFIGVGISIVKNRVTDEIEVVTPLEDAPAYRAGIQAGDIITHVDGEPIKSISLTKVVDIITGPKNTLVNLTIRRGEEVLEFPLTRAKVKIQSVKGIRRDPLNEERWNYWLDKENGIGYIRVTSFQRNTSEDVLNVLSELAGQNLRGLVLDLRSNPGGLLDQAWRVSAHFLERGDTIVTTRGRNPQENHEFPASTKGPYSDLPMMVLVNEGSASASEIVAGAVRDNEHGTVIGARTFGKFSVQNLVPLRHSDAKLKITTARYYLPSGVSLHRDPDSETWGVEPDIAVNLVRWERHNIFKMRREADLLGPPKPKKKDKPKDDAATEVGVPTAKPTSGRWIKKPGGLPDADTTEVQVTFDELPVELVEKLYANTTGPWIKSDGEGDAKTTEAGDESGTEGDTQTADAEKPEEDKLPPLEQPDENSRPMEDAQLDTALLLMRVKLLGDLHPTMASAETAEREHESATTAP